MNISGISGLASKTSYAMFLLKAIQDSYMKKDSKKGEEDSVAFVLFNVKGKDLLAIDQLNDFSDEPNLKKFERKLLKNTINWDYLQNLSKCPILLSIFYS